MDVHPERGAADPAARLRRGDVPAADHGHGRSASTVDRRAATLPRDAAHRRAAAAAGPAQPAVQRGEVHRARAGASCASSRPTEAPVSHATLRGATDVIAFPVIDTGIGIADRASCGSSSRRSSRPTAPPAASTAAPAWACPSAGRSRTCSAARSRRRASWARAAPSPCYLPASDAVRRRRPARRRPGRRAAPPVLELDAAAVAAERRAARRTRRSPAQEGPHRRRRHPQRLRADQRAGAARHDGGLRRERPRGHRGAGAQRRRRPGADGHHDAGDGRLRDDRGDPARCRSSPTCRSSP